MRVYAANPAGLLPGEGCGVVILVRSADARAADVPVYAEIAGWNAVPAGPPELAGLATQVTRPVLFAQAMAQAARAADLIVIAGPDAGLAGRAAECGGMPAVAIPASRGVLAWPGVPAGDGRGPRSGRPGPGPDRPGPGQMALAEAIAAL
jgi:hypothetical protein